MASTVAGANDWLFLGDDSNSSVRQFTGEISMSPQAIEAWGTYFRWMDDQARERNFSYSLLIAPSKESVYQKYYPLPKAKTRPVDNFLSHFPSAIFPADIMFLDKPFCTYSKTDTHWTDLGASMALRHQLRTMGIDLDELPVDLEIDWDLVDQVGDLGNKMTPHVSSRTVMLKGASYGDFRIVNNEIHNHGRIWIFENPDGLIKKRCVLFGDSYGLNLTKFLSRIFSRVAYVHTTTPVPEILDLENPSVVLCEVAERFLPRAPEPVESFSLRKLIAQKIRELPSADQPRYIAAQPKFLELSMAEIL